MKGKRNGTVLLIILVFVSLISLGMIASALMVGVYHQYHVSKRYVKRTQAYYAGEFGYRKGRWLVENDPPLPSDIPYSLAPFTIGNCTVNVTITDEDLDGEYEVESEAYYEE